MQHGCTSSPISRLTYFLASLLNIDILVSSFHITFFHWSSAHKKCYFTHCIRFCGWFLFSGGIFHESYLLGHHLLVFSVEFLHWQKHTSSTQLTANGSRWHPSVPEANLFYYSIIKRCCALFSGLFLICLHVTLQPWISSWVTSYHFA